MTRLSLLPFLRDERGNATVEWVVLAGLLAGVALASIELRKDGFAVFSDKLSEGLTGESDKEFLSVDITNGSFENVHGLPVMSYGFSAASLEGWTSESGHNFEVKNKGYRGADTYDGDYYLDMGESPGNLAISQTFERAQDGEWYNIGLTAYDSVGNNSLEIYFGGVFLGAVVAGDASWHVYDFQVQGGIGDGTNKVLIKETGVEDNWGTYIDSVGFYRLDPDEAEKAQAAADAAAAEAEAGTGS